MSNPTRDQEAICHLIERVAELDRQRADLMEALKVAQAFMSHCWRDVQLNDYSFDQLNGAIGFVDVVISRAESKDD